MQQNLSCRYFNTTVIVIQPVPILPIQGQQFLHYKSAYRTARVDSFAHLEPALHCGQCIKRLVLDKPAARGVGNEGNKI
jgi:hypothetical protein